MVDNEDDDTVTFDMVNTFVYRPDLTKGLTGNEMITIPHLLIMVSCSESLARKAFIWYLYENFAKFKLLFRLE